MLQLQGHLECFSADRPGIVWFEYAHVYHFTWAQHLLTHSETLGAECKHAQSLFYHPEDQGGLPIIFSYLLTSSFWYRFLSLRRPFGMPMLKTRRWTWPVKGLCLSLSAVFPLALHSFCLHWEHCQQRYHTMTTTMVENYTTRYPFSLGYFVSAIVSASLICDMNFLDVQYPSLV